MLQYVVRTDLATTKAPRIYHKILGNIQTIQSSSRLNLILTSFLKIALKLSPQFHINNGNDKCFTLQIYYGRPLRQSFCPNSAN